jgi:twitching motility protein PilJ
MAEKAAEARAAGGRREFVLLALAVALIAFALGGFYYVQSTAARESTWLSEARQMQIDVQEVANIGRDATRGVRPNFLDLSAGTENFDETVLTLREGAPDIGIAPLPDSVSDQVAGIEESWQRMKGSLDIMLEAEVPFGRTAVGVDTIRDAGPEIRDLYEQLLKLLSETNAPSTRLLASSAQLNRISRIQILSGRVLSEGRDADVTATELAEVTAAFRTENNSLLAGAGPAATALLNQVSEKFTPIEEVVELIVADAPEIAKLQTAAATLQGDGTDVLAKSKELEQALIDRVTNNERLLYASFGAGGLAMVFLILFVVFAFLTQRRRRLIAEDRDARQQQAILGLLDDITSLADGDLTGEVKVTEDFTGAIADSINYTIANMRTLVGTINVTSAEISTSATNTAEIARNMNEASERQAREITAVSNTVTASAQSLEQVATRAEVLANQAQASVQTAHDGAETVGRTIQGMAALREQIQDTAKRIKRLGESSQEIGNIIEFINDIAEQTNTLALNASIQAAMAGEQGRGFAVVADEVQRLAERAGNATRQIENLVKTIQADTNEAIISMERSTHNVVTGAKSAEEAGQALTKIESSSQELAKLITEISSSARNQSASATKIAGTMQVIRDIAVQTSGAAGQTASAVAELNSLSGKLRESVSGFKLPESSSAEPVSYP